MSIEQHHEHHPAPAEAGAALARLMDGLTRTLLDLPDGEPIVTPQTQPELDLQPEVGLDELVAVDVVEEQTPDIPSPRSERRHGNLLTELGFLDD